MIGSKVGEGDQAGATKVYRYTLVVSGGVFVAFYSLLYFKMELFVSIFTNSVSISDLTLDIMHLVIFMMLFDYVQAVLYGVVKGLCRQRRTMVQYIVTYYLITLPLAYFVAFRLGTSCKINQDLDDAQVHGIYLPERRQG
jgi:Na+-driven multidrug efflux pump